MNDEQLLRYSRQIMLPEVDIAGQEKLLSSNCLIIGLGGLGSPAALYLAAAGIGEMTLVDHDEVELSNLQRQIVHQQRSIGQPKTESAAATLSELNPDTEIHCIGHKLEGTALTEAISHADIVLDATDNFATRFAINTACWEQQTPLVSGAAIRWEGQVTAFDPNQSNSPCYQCLYASGDDAALNCAESGVISPLVGIIGTCQALEAIKLLLGFPDTLVGHLLYFDAKRMEFQKFGLPKVSTCATCGNSPGVVGDVS